MHVREHVREHVRVRARALRSYLHLLQARHGDGAVSPLETAPASVGKQLHWGAGRGRDGGVASGEGGAGTVDSQMGEDMRVLEAMMELLRTSQLPPAAAAVLGRFALCSLIPRMIVWYLSVSFPFLQ